MRPKKMIAVAILFAFVLQLFGCSSMKLVRPGKEPERLKSKEITVAANDQRSFQFTEIRVYDDTLYGVNGIRFPDDRYSSEVTAVPFSQVESIHFRKSNTVLIITSVVAGLAVLPGVIAATWPDMGI